MLPDILRHLAALVSFDTRNPPRAISADGIFAYIRMQLPDFKITLTDHGAGSVSLLAQRGAPMWLFNVHLDTVPDTPAWSADPFELRLTNEHAIGLGACDIKGAAAALIAAANATRGSAALLFTSDEEGNDPHCVSEFLADDHGFEAAIIAEPTRCEAVLTHRGIASVQVDFNGQAGHASGADALSASALHQAIRWSADALALVGNEAHQRFGGLTGLRFNIGRIEGGVKANVIAPHAQLRFGFRPLPSQDFEQLHSSFRALLPQTASYRDLFRGPPLPAGEVAQAEARRLAARDLADTLGLPVGNAVDFWTEASLFSQAGLAALVFGPGDIAQAHRADEWVCLRQLDQAACHYARLMEH